MSFVLRVAVVALLATACGSAEPWEADFANSLHFSVIEAGDALPAGCTTVGNVSVPARNVHPSARYLGTTYAEFSLSISHQVEELGGNLIVPAGEVGFATAAEWGQSFTATAYRCPSS